MKNLLLITQLLPLVIQVIKAVEAAIPDTGKGAEKLKMVREILEQADDSITAIWPMLEKVIGILVAGFNATGIFAKKATA